MTREGTLVPPEASARARARGRLPIAFGPRFFLILLLGLVWLGPAFWEPRFLLAMAAWDLLLLALWARDLLSLPRPEQLQVVRRWASAPALSVPGEVRLLLLNAGRTTVQATLLDDGPTALRPQPATVEVAAAAGGEGMAPYAIKPVERGDVALGKVYLRYQSPLRLAERWATADVGQQVRIFPNLEEARRHNIYLIRSRQIEMEKRLTRRRGAGREFESLRDYRDGDEMRDICWSASARRGKPVTKQYRVERSQAVWVVVDAGRLLRARVAGLSKLDYAVNAGLTLAQFALYSGDRVGLLAYGRKPVQHLPVGRGSIHLRQMMEQLALVKGEASEADHLRAAQTMMREQKRRSLVVWLTDLAETAMNPEVIDGAMRMTPRHLVLFVVIGEPELGRKAEQVPKTVPEMFESAAAQEVIHRRELLLARLRQRGALALEIAPAGLSTALVNHYLEIKEQSRL